MSIFPIDHLGAGPSRSDKLLRASVSGYCSLTRPGRQEAQQLQDLALPLLDGASRDTLRYASAALSSCETEPTELMRRLAYMSVDIAAPVLARASSLTDIDLIEIIGRHGHKHAAVIASRENLHPSIRQLTDIVEAKHWTPGQPTLETTGALEPEDDAGDVLLVEETRERLRSIMRATRQERGTDVSVDHIYVDMRESALSGSTDQLAASLANALGVVLPLARTIVRDASCSMLTPALRAIGLAEEEAFLIASAAFPLRFPNADTIRGFLAAYRAMSFEEIEIHLTRWQETGAAAVKVRQAR